MNKVVEWKYLVLTLNQYRLFHTNIHCWILQQTANHVSWFTVVSMTINRQEHAVLGVDASGKVASFALRALLPVKYFAFIITHIFQSSKTFWLSIMVSGSPFRHKRKSRSVEPPFHIASLTVQSHVIRFETCGCEANSQRKIYVFKNYLQIRVDGA